MPPAKSRANQHHEDAKSEATNSKEKNGQGQQTNGKLRRVTSTTSNNQFSTGSAKASTTSATNDAHKAVAQTALQWSSSFDRDTLHEYRREYKLDTPTSFANNYHNTILSRPGGIGLYSPTMARRPEYRRQTKNELGKVVKEHVSGLSVQENDVVVNFLHRVKNPGITKPKRNKKTPHSGPIP